MTTFTRQIRRECVGQIAACFLVVSALLAINGTANASVIHTGSADPTTEGWTLYSSGATTGGQETIGGSQYNYWQVNDNSDVNAPFYHAPGTAAILDNAQGWTLTGVLRVSGPVSTSAWPVSISVDDGHGKMWNLTFYNGTDESGTGVYRGQDGNTTLLKAMDVSSAYHTYQLLFKPNGTGLDDDTADVFIDGTLITNITRAQADAGLLSGEVNFGSITSGGTGSANYAYVALEAGNHIIDAPTVVPEPSTAILLGGCLLGLLVGVCRKRK